jgi:hypothetical protein
MSEESNEFRQRLLGAQKMSSDLERAYRKEVEEMVHPPMTARSALPGAVLMVILVICAGLIVRTAIVHSVGPLLMSGYAVLAVAFVWAAALIIRDLLRRRHSQKSVGSVAGALTAAAGTVTVVALLMGLKNPSDPKSLFGAFYVFVFYFACVMWALENRIKSAELAAREQGLRIEYRLADLAERMGKAEC